MMSDCIAQQDIRLSDYLPEILVWFGEERDWVQQEEKQLRRFRWGDVGKQRFEETGGRSVGEIEEVPGGGADKKDE